MTRLPSVRPTDIGELSDLIAGAASKGERLAIIGGGSKAEVGCPTTVTQLDMSGFSGIVDYDPSELVLTLRPGTPLADVQALVRQQGQMLAFDPFDHGPLFGRPLGKATIGGIVAAGVAGSFRLTRGGPRDHLLGFKAVSGRGEPFTAGAKVVKNVTGYDLPKLMAGSWGRLAAFTELTLKVLPRPPVYTTLLIAESDPAAAVAIMARAMGSHADVTAAAFLPDWQGRPVIALGLLGFPASVAARCEIIRSLLTEHSAPERLEGEDCTVFWSAIACAAPLPPQSPLWRIQLAPSQAPLFIGSVSGDWFFDWAGGLIWLASDLPPPDIRAAAERLGGHAMLVRADRSLRSTVPALHPPVPAIARLEERVRRAFDPAGVFETGRF